MAPTEVLEQQGAGLRKQEDLTLLHEVSIATAGVSNLEMCIQCGSCGGSCPSAADMDHTPQSYRQSKLPGVNRPL